MPPIQIQLYWQDRYRLNLREESPEERRTGIRDLCSNARNKDLHTTGLSIYDNHIVIPCSRNPTAQQI